MLYSIAFSILCAIFVFHLLSRQQRKVFLSFIFYFWNKIFEKDCFELCYEFLTKPKKIDCFSFNSNGDILKNKNENKVYFNDDIMNIENLKIDLTRNFNSYNHKYEYYKYLFRSNILLYFDDKKSKSLKENLNNADFFIFRGAFSYLAGAFKDDRNIVLWAINIDGVIVIADEFVNGKKSKNELLTNYIGLNFENIVCSKKKESIPNYTRYVRNWEQYKEVNVTDIYISYFKKIRVAYCCEIDAFDRNTGKLLELKTKYRNLTNKNELFTYKTAIATFFQCMLGNIHEIVVGVKCEHYIVDKICRYKTGNLLNIKRVDKAVKVCCKQLCYNFQKIKKNMKYHCNKGCIKIVGMNNCEELRITHYKKYPPELKRLFTRTFCNKFSIN